VSNGGRVIAGFAAYLILGTALIVNTPPSKIPDEPYRQADIGETAMKVCPVHGQVLTASDRCPAPGCRCLVVEGIDTVRQSSPRHDQ